MRSCPDTDSDLIHVADKLNVSHNISNQFYKLEVILMKIHLNKVMTISHNVQRSKLSSFVK